MGSRRTPNRDASRLIQRVPKVRLLAGAAHHHQSFESVSFGEQKPRGRDGTQLSRSSESRPSRLSRFGCANCTPRRRGGAAQTLGRSPDQRRLTQSRLLVRAPRRPIVHPPNRARRHTCRSAFGAVTRGERSGCAFGVRAALGVARCCASPCSDRLAFIRLLRVLERVSFGIRAAVSASGGSRASRGAPGVARPVAQGACRSHVR